MTWNDLVRIASELPGVEVSTSYGTPALKTRGKLLTRLRPERDSIVILDVPPDERAMLIQARPEVFHITPHYAGWPSVLAYLATIDPETARHFLERRWRSVAPRTVVRTWDDRASVSAKTDRHPGPHRGAKAG